MSTTSTQFAAAVRDNTKMHQSKLRSCELRSAEASKDDIGLQQRFAGLLRKVAGLQLDAGSLSAEVARELEFRAGEERSLRLERDSIEAEIAGLVKAIRQRSEEIVAETSQLDAHQTAQQLLQSARAAYQQAEAAHTAQLAMETELRAEIDAKLAQFHADELYRFLIEVAYGTENYGRTGDQAEKDKWLAGLCNFEKNRASELILRGMDEALPALVAATAVAREAAASAMDEASRAPTSTSAERLARANAPLEEAIAQAEVRAAKVRAALDDHAARRDPRFRKAQELQAAGMKSLTIDALIAHARATSSLEADEVVRELAQLQEQLDQSGSWKESARAAQRQAEADLERAKQLERELKAAGYLPEGRVEFDGSPDWTRLIAGYMNGEMSSSAAALEVRHYVRAAPAHARYGETAWGSTGNRS
jgi:hypothetical protein